MRVPVSEQRGRLARERARPDWLREHPQAWRYAVGAVCFGAFMGQLDASIVTMAYGPLRLGFSASLASVQWVSLAYLAVLAALLVPVGRLSDSWGRKLLYLYGFGVFTAASLACGLAWSLGVLIVFRGLQAVGAALLQANSVALVVTSTPREFLRHALGLQAGAQALGLALGPLVGGLLVSTVGWRGVFLVNVPIGLVAITAGRFLLPRTHSRRHTARFDWPGALLFGATIVAFLLALSVVSGMPWPVPTALGLAALGTASAVGLGLRQRRAAEPLVDPALWQARGVRQGLAGALAGYLVLFGPLVLVPVVLTARGMAAFPAGLVLTALPLGFAAAAVLADRLLPARWESRARCLRGGGLAILALAAMWVAPTSPWVLVPTLLALGLALGVFTPANNSLVMGAFPAGASGTGGGLVNTARGVGTALGVALVTLALQAGSGVGSLLGARAAVALLLLFAVLALLTAVERSPRPTRGAAQTQGAGR